MLATYFCFTVIGTGPIKKLICAAMFALISTAVLADDPDALVIGDPNCRIENPNPRQNERVTWDGQCKDGYAEGTGILQWYLNEKPSSRYEGGMAHGLPHGTGVYAYANNVRYEGGFANGQRNGQGTITRPNGYKFIATFENNETVGIVEIHYPNGASYKGMYKNYQPEGQGRMVYAEGFIYDGEWKNGKRSGHGILTRQDGSRLIAMFENDAALGEVELHYTNGALYLGMFKNGQPEGNGRMVSSDGTIYEGEWKRGKQDGHGHQEFTNGATYEGEFKNGLFDGMGVIKYKGGNKYNGYFKNGLRDTPEGPLESTDMTKEEIQSKLTAVDERISAELVSFTDCHNSNAYQMGRAADGIVELRRLTWSNTVHVDIADPVKKLFATYQSMGGLTEDPYKVEKTADPCAALSEQLKFDIDAETVLQRSTDKFSKETDGSFKKAVIDFSACNKIDYPRLALYLKQEGTIRVAFLIGAYGLVNYSFVAKSSGVAVLDDAAIEALSKCHFTAGKKNGQPISTWTNVDYVFKLPI